MRTFSIDTDNNITAHADVPADAANLETFASAKELAKLTAEWPAYQHLSLERSPT